MLAILRDEIGLKKDEEITSMGINAYSQSVSKNKNLSAKNKIAVIYAEGTVVDGEGENGQIGGDKYSKIIRDIRKDKKVKAIVLRVNSGGGSGMASEKIWRELTLAKKQGIPVIVSMGDVAASGGYYIACMADSIFAERNTLTGSIGVFGTVPSMADFMRQKLGITADTVKTGQFSTGVSPFYDVSEAEGKILQQSVEEFYDIFLTRVADGRKMKKEAVHNIAQGRVWTGQKALEIGLVDGFGDLETAIAAAKRTANITDFRIAEYPQIKDPFEQLIDELMGKDKTEKAAKAMLKTELGELYPYYEQMQWVRSAKGIQAVIPYQIEVR
jgi:protease-4